MIKPSMVLCRVFLAFLLFVAFLVVNDAFICSIPSRTPCNQMTRDMMVVDDSIATIVSNMADSSLVLSAQQQAVDLSAVVSQAFDKAIAGGKAGALAGAAQVMSLMWLRTAVNYQYRYGTPILEALNTLYKEGGIPRLYAGLPLALIQGPLARFGDTAANILVLQFSAAALSDSSSAASGIPLFVQTGLGSLIAASWRVALMPIDTWKTTSQVHGSQGWSILQAKIATAGVSTLFDGALATCVATWVGHFPWFLTYNYLSEHLPHAAEVLARYSDSDSSNSNVDTIRIVELCRSAVIGIAATSISDTCSNSFRVLKTAKQTMVNVTYVEAAQQIVEKEGFNGLWQRGLQARLLSNLIQGVAFSVLFKYFQQS